MATLDLLVKVAVQNQRALETLSGKIGSVGRNLTLGVTTPLIAAGGAFVAMAVEAEKSQAKLESLFENTEADAWTSIEALREHQEALADATTFDDDAVAEAQAALLAFGDITGEQFTGATEAAADLAAFMETDIPTAAQQLGKALSDPESGLGRLQKIIGPLTDAQQQAIDKMIEAGDVAGAQQAILDAVSDAIGTTAEDLAATTGGGMTQAMNELGEAGEAIGIFLLPVLAGVSSVLKDMATAFTELDPGVQGFIVGFAGVLLVLGPVLLLISAIAPAIGLIAGAIALVLSPIGLLAVAVIGIAVLIVAKWDEIVYWTGQLGNALNNIFGAIGQAFEDLGTWIGDVWDNITGVFGDAVDAIGDAGKKMWEPVKDGFGSAIDGVKGIWNAFVRFWNGIQISVPSVDIPLVGRVGGFTIGLPDLPYLAEGGIVTQPTLAVIGERGPEAVVPLDKGYGTHETHIHLTYAGDMPDEPEDLVALLRQVAPFVDGRLRVAD
jgi:hypothetical protein